MRKRIRGRREASRNGKKRPNIVKVHYMHVPYHNVLKQSPLLYITNTH